MKYSIINVIELILKYIMLFKVLFTASKIYGSTFLSILLYKNITVVLRVLNYVLHNSYRFRISRFVLENFKLEISDFI